jgi:ABC-2 type transport system ATP-binding protein
MTSHNDNNALVVKNISKVFTIPHEKISTLRGLFVSMFRPKSYETFHALKNISFTVKKGESFGIVGRNGSGKSTLLKILAKVYTADQGECVVNGKISPFLELGIGFNQELSGRDNVYLNASVLGMLQEEIDEAYDSIVAFSELERFMDQKLKNYSSGMKVRLAFSVAIHANREILLMDEVLAVGDAAFQEKCIRELTRLREEGKTIILVSHSEQSIRDFTDRVLVLNKGKMETLDTPDKALAVYAKLLSK